MTFRVLQVKQGRTVTVLIDTANSTFAPGNASLAVGGETVVGLTIRSVITGVGTGGGVTVLRGANVVIQSNTSMVFDFAGQGYPLTLDAAANVTVNFVGANNTCLVDMAKLYNQANNAGGANTSY
jgi:hypothetical protein